MICIRERDTVHIKYERIQESISASRTDVRILDHCFRDMYRIRTRYSRKTGSRIIAFKEAR